MTHANTDTARTNTADTESSVWRYCFAAAHVCVLDGYREIGHRVDSPGNPDELAEWIDWESTLAFRRRLDGLGFGIAEAMDTAQRFSLGWKNAKQLIAECGKLGLKNGFIAGAGADHLDGIKDADELIRGVVDQGRFIQQQGGMVIILPLPWLVQSGCGADDYVDVYRCIIDELDGPIFIHWLGEAFMARLKGYFPEDSFMRVMNIDTNKVRGAKLSLLDADFEVRTRAELLEHDQFILTGDDFNFSRLIEGDNTPVRHTRVGEQSIPLGDFSHALLGILDGIAEPASRALIHLRNSELDEYRRLMEPCEELGQCIFQKPTQFYKSGLAFLAWANDLQPNPMLLNHEERARDRAYYREVAKLALRADVLTNHDKTAAKLSKMDGYLT